MPWRNPSYHDWNERLIDHIFGSESAVSAERVTRIPASPDLLWAVIGQPAEVTPDDALAGLVRRIQETVPPGRSICGFCLADPGSWSPRSLDYPDFFPVLWLSCLICQGHPDDEGSFSARLARVLGRPDHLDCLPELWRSFAEWTARTNALGEPRRILELPAETGHRTIIGFSHFLAFPMRRDRRALASLLEEHALTGVEPPIRLVVTAIMEARSRFTAEFNRDLDRFVEEFVHGGREPRDSAFWRAVRQEALEPTPHGPGMSPRTRPRTMLLFRSADEGGLLPVVGCEDEGAAPAGWVTRPLEAAGVPLHITAADGAWEPAWVDVFGVGSLIPVGLRNLIKQGVLVLRPRSSWVWEVATGADINGCSDALVRDERSADFRAAFGGRAFPAAVAGWVEIQGCVARQVDDLAGLPPGLAGLTQILRTTMPPSVQLVGGIRVGGGFLSVDGFLPRVRAPGAEHVVMLDGSGVAACTPTSNPVDWLIPAGVPAGRHRVRATWRTLGFDGKPHDRIGETALSLEKWPVSSDYKPIGARRGFLEGCPTAETEVASHQECPVGITTPTPTGSADLLDLDVTARFLGPGVGEMSLDPRPGFDWLVVGSKKSPECLVFVGDPSRFTPPAARRSENAGNRRQWNQAFINAPAFHRGLDGELRALDDRAPEGVQRAWEAYRHHRVPLTAESCAGTGLATYNEPGQDGVEPGRELQVAADAIAALAVRRAGLHYDTVRQVFGGILGVHDPILVQQVLRGWTEGGQLDTLRDPRTGFMSILARRPRLVIYRRGTESVATVLGLVDTITAERLRSEAGSALRTVRAPSALQPATYRVQGAPADIERLRVSVGLPPSEWLDWPDRDELPSKLDVRTSLASLPTSAPMPAYRPTKVWDWSVGGFARGSATGRGVELEQRVHPDMSSIYVVLDDGASVTWTYLRAWALVAAHVRRATRPFTVDCAGRLESTGRAPAHLPLPLARLCALIGIGLPGLRLDPGAGTSRYVYPFGRRLQALVRRALPEELVEQAPDMRDLVRRP